MPRIPLPVELLGSAIRTTSAPEHGITTARLRGRDVQHPFHGVSSAQLDLSDLRARCLAFLPVMESGQVFSHTTALALHGVPLPVLPDDLHVSVAYPRTPPRRAGIRGHSLRKLSIVMRNGMPVSAPAAAWAESAALLTREDLTAAGDHLLLTATSVHMLGDAVAAARGRPGAVRLSWAGERIRHGVRSRPETHLRLLLTGSGLPEPVVAPPVAVRGGIVVHPDLAYPQFRLALEYEGDGHREAGRWERDIERRELLAEADWRTIRITKAQLYGDPRELIARIRRHLST